MNKTKETLLVYYFIIPYLRWMDMFSRETTFKIVLPPFWKVICSKRKEFVPSGRIKVDLFSEGTSCGGN